MVENDQKKRNLESANRCQKLMVAQQLTKDGRGNLKPSFTARNTCVSVAELL